MNVERQNLSWRPYTQYRPWGNKNNFVYIFKKYGKRSPEGTGWIVDISPVSVLLGWDVLRRSYKTHLWLIPMTRTRTFTLYLIYVYHGDTLKSRPLLRFAPSSVFTPIVVCFTTRNGHFYVTKRGVAPHSIYFPANSTLSLPRLLGE